LVLGGLTGFVENPGPGPGRPGFAARPSCRCLSPGSLHRGVQRSIVASLHATMQRLQRWRCNIVALQCSLPGVGATMQRRPTDRAPLGRRLGFRHSRSDRLGRTPGSQTRFGNQGLLSGFLPSRSDPLLLQLLSPSNEQGCSAAVFPLAHLCGGRYRHGPIVLRKHAEPGCAPR
jgi:hypothetical protein